MRRRHLPSVLRIENAVYPRPWTMPLFLSELGSAPGRHYAIARIEGRIAGYAGLMVALDEAHVVNIAVDPAWQRRHVGARLLVHLARVAAGRGARHATLEVRTSNSAAQAMYRRFGFETEGVRKNYYAETGEDALVMWAHDIDTPGYARKLTTIEASFTGATRDEALG